MLAVVSGKKILAGFFFSPSCVVSGSHFFYVAKVLVPTLEFHASDAQSVQVPRVARTDRQTETRHLYYRSGVAQNAMLKALEIPKISLFAVFVFVLIPP